MSTYLGNLVQLNKSHAKPASEILARAFHDYPIVPYFFPDETERDRISPYFFQVAIDYCLKYGEVYAISENLEGIAAWLHSDYFPMTFWRLVRSVPLSVLFRFGSQGGARMRHLGEFIDATHMRLAPFEHSFLQMIGVAPQFQGNGYAGKLLRPMLARIDREGLPCYLDTNSEQRVFLYQHFGFKVMEKATIPGTELTNWAMLREANCL